ncbi:TonB-dependent siderophore receptor [Pseudoalteromonas sp. SCQQ13]|uniref:TonB-dependent siderophore receptor n=1 Tax=Pseudoalteromonas sp. SCQQ13 TaxID=2792066 RepID=UPI0018CFE659|nr:TonB-dependent siderophore receptor [Pseudoalteromonas sp. SCQQ13]MBH0092580.1 TonB-dependent siderophore receptor [Pseudoalteromonas sp. SCQQ13]
MNTNFKERKLTYLSACLVFLFTSQTSSAFEQPPLINQANTAIERVAVIGSRHVYSSNFTPLETPQAEQTIDLATLENAGAWDLNQALDLSASVARQNNFGGLLNNFALRGFTGDENLSSNYLVNGFNIGWGLGGTRDLSSIASVEVLKGPRAALFGRGEPGGVVNLITKRPTFDTAGELKLAVASEDTYRADIDYTTGVSDDVAIRLIGFYEDSNSFRDTIKKTKQGVSPSVAWYINDNSELIYELEYSKQTIPFDRGVLAINGELGVIPANRFLGEPGDGPITAQVVGHQLELKHDINDDWSVLIAANYRDTKLTGFATETGFAGVVNDEVNRFRRYRDYSANYKVLRGEVTGDINFAGFEHRLTIGADTDKFENDQFLLQVKGDQYINVYNPEYGAYALPAPTTHTDRIEIQQSLGVFIQDQISLTNKLDIRLGARLDDFKQTLNNRLTNTGYKQTESRISPQLGAVYAVSDFISAYAAYGENFRPLSGTDAQGNGFKPNQTTSKEVGVKVSLNNGALVGTLALFKVEQQNMLVVDDPTAFTSAAIGEAQSKGFEIDINGQLTNNLNLWASYAYVDATTKNSFYDSNFGLNIAAGSSLLNIPQHQLSLQLVKSTEVNGKALKLGGGLLYVGDRNGFFGTDFTLPSYITARAFMRYAVSDSITLTGELDNLFNETYYISSFSDAWVQPGTPRSVRFSASFKF